MSLHPNTARALIDAHNKRVRNARFFAAVDALVTFALAVALIAWMIRHS